MNIVSTVGHDLGINQIHVHIHHSVTIIVNKTKTYTRFVIQLAPHMIVEEGESIWYRTSEFKRWRALATDDAMQAMYDAALAAGGYLTVCPMIDVGLTDTS